MACYWGGADGLASCWIYGFDWGEDSIFWGWDYYFLGSGCDCGFLTKGSLENGI